MPAAVGPYMRDLMSDVAKAQAHAPGRIDQDQPSVDKGESAASLFRMSEWRAFVGLHRPNLPYACLFRLFREKRDDSAVLGEQAGYVGHQISRSRLHGHTSRKECQAPKQEC